MSSLLRPKPSAAPRSPNKTPLLLYLLIPLVLALTLGVGCSRAPRHFAPEPGASYPMGMFHKIVKGETLSGIARFYQRDMLILAYFNDLRSPYTIRQGAHLYIPPTNDRDILRSNSVSLNAIRAARSRLDPDAPPPTAKYAMPAKYPVKRATRAKYPAKRPTSASKKTAPKPPAKKPIAVASVPKKYARDKKFRAGPTATNTTTVASRKPTTPIRKASIPRTSKPKPRPASGKLHFIWPLENCRYVRGFATNWLKPHRGVDLAAPHGTEIRAMEDGEVLQTRDMSTYGNIVVINHGNGYSSVYAHVSRFLVHEDQRVRKGQSVARVGNTGRSTGPHLHFEIRYNGEARNPEIYLPKKKPTRMIVAKR